MSLTLFYILQNKPEVSELIKGKSVYHLDRRLNILVYQLYVLESKEYRFYGLDYCKYKILFLYTPLRFLLGTGHF